MFQSHPSLQSLLLQQSYSSNEIAQSYSPIVVFVKNFQCALNEYLFQNAMRKSEDNDNSCNKALNEKKKLIKELIQILTGFAEFRHWMDDSKLEENMKILTIINSHQSKNPKKHPKPNSLYQTKLIQSKLMRLLSLKQKTLFLKSGLSQQFQKIKEEIQKNCTDLQKQLAKISLLVSGSALFSEQNKENIESVQSTVIFGKKSEYQKLFEISSIKKGINFQKEHHCQVEIFGQIKHRKWVDTGFTEGKERCISKGEITQFFSRKSIPEDRNGHYKTQIVEFKDHLDPSVFASINPEIHRVYISQLSSSYDEITPLKLSLPSPKTKLTAGLTFSELVPALCSPKIETKNYFSEQVPLQKLALHYCKPNTKLLYTYYISDIQGVNNSTKQFLQTQELKIQWNFGNFVRTAATANGDLYGINCRTTESKVDPSLYQITSKKISNRGKLPKPLRQCSFIYRNNFLYVIGGYNLGQKTCSSSCYKYSLKTYKWTQLRSCHIGTKNSTVCTYQNRYIIKIGGLNQFNFLCKEIEIYDTINDRWSILQACLKHSNEEVPILQDSAAVQINQKQILIFGGKNSSGFTTDNSAILEIKEIREKIKADSKVYAEIFSADKDKKNFLSFSGNFTQFNPIVHNNFIYCLRSQFSTSPPKQKKRISV